MNKVIITGNAVADAEIRNVAVGERETQVAKFCIAVKRNTKEEQVDFLNCTAWGKTAEIAEKYIMKGTKLLVEGSMQTDKYTNKDGNNVYYTYVNVNRVEFLGSKPKTEETEKTEQPVEAASNVSNPVQETPSATDFDILDMDDDELPFN